MDQNNKIDNISEGFVEKYNAVFYKTKSSLVDVKAIDIYSKHKEKFDKPIKFKEYKEGILFDLLLNNKEKQKTIVLVLQIIICTTL